MASDNEAQRRLGFWNIDRVSHLLVAVTLVLLLLIVGKCITALFLRVADLKAYDTYGPAGKLIIEDVSIVAPLYEASNGMSYQDVVDAKHEALIRQLGSQIIVADHVSDGYMRNLKNTSTDMTAKIEQDDGSSESFVCVSVTDGYVSKEDGDKSDLFCFDGQKVREMNSGGLCVYTCWMDQDPELLEKYNAKCLVTITFWQPIKL